MPARQLSLTFYVIAVSTFIFTTYGYRGFQEGDDKNFLYDDQSELFEELGWFAEGMRLPHRSYDDGPFDDDFDDGQFDAPLVSCDTLLQCTTLFLYKGVPAGDVGNVIDAVDLNSEDYAARVMYDLVFFIWVGVLLFNILIHLKFLVKVLQDVFDLSLQPAEEHLVMRDK